MCNGHKINNDILLKHISTHKDAACGHVWIKYNRMLIQFKIALSNNN